MKVRDVHQDAVLTNFAIGYHPQGFIAEQIVPVVPVNNESDKYYIWDKHSAFNVSANGKMSLRADKSEAKEVDFKLSTATYTAEEYALKILISQREKNNADSPLRLRESKLRRLQDLMLLEQEIRVASLLTTAANWDTAHTATPAVKWDAASGVQIENNIDAAKLAVRRAIGVLPNTIVIPPTISVVAKKDPTLRELIKYTQQDLLVNGDLPPTFFEMRTVIPGATYTTSKEGTAAASVTYADVWGDNILLLYVPPADMAMDAPSGAKIFRTQDWNVDAWDVPEKKRAEAIEVSVVQDEVLTSNVAGFLYTDVLTG